MEKDGPLDGRKYNQNNKDSQMGQVTPKKYLKKKDFCGEIKFKNRQKNDT